MYRWAMLYRLHNEEIVCEYKSIGPAPEDAPHPGYNSQVWLGIGNRKVASFDYFMASPFIAVNPMRDIN